MPNEIFGPYVANPNGTISYRGNKIFGPISDVKQIAVPTEEISLRAEDMSRNPMWSRIARINHRINMAANSYFDELGALFVALPMTTRMISSPGAVYGRKALNYTTDTVPLKLKWFDLEKPAFLAESSQIYLELALLEEGIDKVYSIYNSFRQEPADATHLSEFHHMEFEGKVTQDENLTVISGLISKIVNDIVELNESDLRYFLSDDDFQSVEEIGKMKHIPTMEFRQALNQLYDATNEEKYKEFSLKHFGSWEEIKVTSLNDGLIGIRHYPLLEIPFYHAPIIGSNPAVGDNTDIIFPSYRETVGSGHRVRSLQELEEKAVIFNLPRKDYEPYLQTRRDPNYKETSGFGLGWERFLQGILKTPFIWSATHFPRVHTTLLP